MYVTEINVDKHETDNGLFWKLHVSTRKMIYI